MTVASIPALLALALFVVAPALAGEQAPTAPQQHAEHAKHDEHATHTPHEQADAQAHDSAHGGHDHHAGHAAMPEVAADHVRWPIDAALGRGMARVQAASDALADLHATGTPDPARSRAIANDLRSAVNTMFAECRLPPEPDAALHRLLAQVLDAARQLTDGDLDGAAATQLRTVLTRYRELFDDPA